MMLPEWVPWKNTAGSTCSAHSVVRITGITTGVLQGAQPNSYGLLFGWAVNGHYDVAANAYGVCTFARQVWVAYNNAATPAYGESWGPINGRWDVWKLGTGFTVLGDHQDGRVLCVRSEFAKCLGQYTGSVAAGATGTVNIYYWTSTPTWTALSINSTQQTVSTVINTTGASISSGKKLSVEDNQGRYVAGPLECE